VAVGFGVAVAVAVAVGLGVTVAVAVGLGVAVAVGLGVAVAVAVGFGVGVAVPFGVAVAVGLTVAVGVAVGFGVAVGVGVGPVEQVPTTDHKAGTFGGSHPVMEVCPCTHLYSVPLYVTNAPVAYAVLGAHAGTPEQFTVCAGRVSAVASTNTTSAIKAMDDRFIYAPFQVVKT
jgi:hypothetical protein